MYCPSCGKENPSGSAYCAYCGAKLEAAAQQPSPPVVPPAAPAAPPPAAPPPVSGAVPYGPQVPGAVPYPYPTAPAEPSAPTSTLAIVSLILGVLGLFTMGLSSIVGLILGIASLVQISKSQGRVRGSGVAVAGTVVSGFTLLSLPLMAAILFPVFARAREKARQASCQSNLKQIGLAMMMYTQDFDEEFPMTDPWADSLMPYMKNEAIFHCPSATNDPQRSYGYNAALNLASVATLSSPAETVMNFDSQPGPNPAGGNEILVPRHNEGANICYADGHVKWSKGTITSTLLWNPPGVYAPPPWLGPSEPAMPGAEAPWGMPPGS